MAATAAWAAGFLALADVALSSAFRYPSSPDVVPSTLQQYFDYGRSVQSKLARQLRPDGFTSSLGAAGWLPPPAPPGAPAHPPLVQGRVSFYGMSFTARLADEVGKMDPRLDVRSFGGPAAPPNHVFANFERHRHLDPSATVVVGILASSTYGMTTMTGGTMNFEGAAPFTYPRYHLRGTGEEAGLVEVDPELADVEAVRAALHDPARWASFEAQLAREDRFYSPLVFDANLLDRSALARVLRRGYASGRQRDEIARLHGRPGEIFGNDGESREVLRALVRQMSADARADGRRLIVVLLQDRGFTDGLRRLLAPTLERHDIEFLSSDSAIDSKDGTNFQPDGHYSVAANRRLAEQLHAMLVRPAGPAGK